jgi:hypothetical protein
MKFGILLLALIASAYAQTSTFKIYPQVATSCTPNGFARVDLSWTAQPGAVQVRVGSPIGPALTGLEPATGGASTDNWVIDGMVFVLLNVSGLEVARATAAVDCGAGISTGYFPLNIGDEWTYRLSNRSVTSAYQTFRVVDTERFNGFTWFAVSAGGEPDFYRTATDGKVYKRTALTSEELWFDSNLPVDPNAVLQITSRGTSFTTPSGMFPDTIGFQTTIGGLNRQTGAFARGIGLIARTSTLLSGSSGGFLEGLDLVRAVIAGNLVFNSRAVSLELGVEKRDLFIVPGNITNCAVPCFNASCGLGGSNPDPPGTFKPCLQTRIQVRGVTGGQVDLELFSPQGLSLRTDTSNFSTLPGISEATVFRQLPLYTQPNIPVPAGSYQLKAKYKTTDGTEQASAVVDLIVR